MRDILLGKKESSWYWIPFSYGIFWIFISRVKLPFDGAISSTRISIKLLDKAYNSILARSGIWIDLVIIGNSGDPFSKIGTPPGIVILVPPIVFSEK